MIRLLGIVLLSAGCALAGLLKSAELARRCRALEALRTGLEQLRRELELSRAPLPRLMERLALRAPSPAGELFARCGRALERLDREPFPEAWRGLCEQLSALTPEDRDVLLPLGEILGRCGAREQSDALAGVCRALEERRRLAREDSREKGRVCRALGAAAGGFLAILLL